jgi:hypothetical protein
MTGHDRRNTQTSSARTEKFSARTEKPFALSLSKGAGAKVFRLGFGVP